MKKLLLILLAACMMFLIACGTSDTPEPGTAQPSTPGGDRPPSGANLADHIEVQKDGHMVAVINPFVPAGNTGPTQWTFTMIYDRLIRWIEETDEYLPQLAERWETTDYRHFTFHLRNDAVFHNGDRFTAEDVAATIRIAQEHPGTIGFDRWRSVESVNIPDPYTIEITLDDVNVGFLFEIANPSAGILNEAAFLADSERGTWIGTGPFRVTGFNTNDFVTMERFDDYWGEAPPTRSITLRWVPEPAARLMMMENGQSQIGFGITPEDLDLLVADPNFTVLPARQNNPQALGFNMADPLMSNIDFRKAIFHALYLPPIGLAAAGENGAEPPQEGNIWGFITPNRHTGIPLWEHNLDLARQHLASSPYVPGEVIEIVTQAGTFGRATELVQHQLRQIGLETEIRILDGPSFNEYVRFGANQSQLHVFTLSTTLNPITNVLNTFTPAGGANRYSYDNPVVSDLIERARVNPDADERNALLLQIQDVLNADPPAINMYWRVGGVATVNGIGGVRVSVIPMLHNLRGAYWDLDQTPANLRP